jgi:hypothetical protein
MSSNLSTKEGLSIDVNPPNLPVLLNRPDATPLAAPSNELGNAKEEVINPDRAAVTPDDTTPDNRPVTKALVNYS